MANNGGWEDIPYPSTNQTPVKPSLMGPPKGQETYVSAPKRTLTDFFNEAFDRATSYSGEGETGAYLRGLEDLFNLDDRFQQAQEGGTPKSREDYRDKVRVQKVREQRALWKALDEADPSWRENGSLVGNVARFTAGMLGDLAGNTNPDYMLAPGKTIIGRIAGQTGVNAGVDTFLQSNEMREGIQDDYDLGRTAWQALAGAIFQSGGEGISALWRKFRGKDVDEGAYVKEINDALTKGGGRTELNAINERYGKEPFGEELDGFLARREDYTTPDGGTIARPKEPEAATKNDAIEVLREMQKERPEDAQLIEDIITGKDAGVDNPRYDELSTEARQRLEGQGFQEQWPPVEGLGTTEKFEDLSGRGREGPEVQIYTPGELEQRINTKLVQLEEADAQSAAPMTQPEADPFEIQYRTPDEEAIVQDAIQKVSSDWGVPPQDLMNDPAMFNRVQAAIQERGGRGDLLDKEMAPDVGEAPEVTAPSAPVNEVQIETSQASRSGERIRLTTRNVKRGTPPGNAAKTFLRELGIYNNLELMEMPMNEAIERASRLGIDQDWLDYFNDAKWNPATKTIDTPTPRPDMSRYLPDVEYTKGNTPVEEAPSQVSDALVQIRKLANDMHIDASTEGGKYTIGQIGAFHKRISEGLEKGEWKGADLEEAQNIKAFLDEAALMQDQAIRAREAEQGYSEQPPSATVRNPDTSAGNVRTTPANDKVDVEAIGKKWEEAGDHYEQKWRNRDSDEPLTEAEMREHDRDWDAANRQGAKYYEAVGNTKEEKFFLSQIGNRTEKEQLRLNQLVDESTNDNWFDSFETDNPDEIAQAVSKGISSKKPSEVTPVSPNKGAGNVRPIPANENVGDQLFPTEAERAVLGDNPSNADLQEHRGVRVDPRTGEVEILSRGGGDGGQPPREPPSDGGGGGSEEPPIDPEELFSRLTERLRTARKAGAEQEAARTQERSKRLQEVAKTRQYTSGEQGYYAEKSKLSGKLPKAEIEPVRDEFSQREIDALFDFVKEKDGLYGNTRAALVKLLSGEIPSAREIQLLSDIFPKPLVKEILKKRSRGQKLLDFATNAVNLPRSLMSSYDLSFLGRQGIFLVGRKEFWKSWGTMFKVFGSERAYKALMDDIKARPTYPLMEEAGLDLTTHGHDFTAREEQFMSQWAEKIPVVGIGVKASERAFTGAANKLRADVFDSLVSKYNEAGIDVSQNSKILKDIAWFVNNATGRGDLGRFSKAGPMLNGLFFSPRLMASRVNLLRPDNYIKLDPIVRQEAIKSLLSFGGIALTVTALAKQGGMEVEGDPRSSDFAKLKTGDTRYDILGGFGQYLTLGARLATNETKKLNGDLQELGKKYGSDTRLDVLLKFLMNKESPIASFVTDYLRGSNAIGEPFEMKTAVAQRFIPLFAQDLTDMVEKKGPVGALMAAPALFGVGIQDYGKEKSRDMFGRDNTDGTPKSEVDLEIERLGKPLKGELVGKPRKTIYVGKNEYGEAVNRTMTPEEYDNYTYLSGQYILESIKQEMQNPDWKLRSDNDKRDIVRDIVKDMRKQAREDLFTPKTSEETEGWKDL